MPEPAAALRTSDTSVEFYVVFEKGSSPRGSLDPSIDATLNRPNQLVLVRLEQSRTRRQLTAGAYKAVVSKSRSSSDIIPFDAQQVGANQYRLTPRVALAPGEYGFLTVITGLSLLFDFGVTSP